MMSIRTVATIIATRIRKPILKALCQPQVECCARMTRCVKTRLTIKRMIVPAKTKIWAAIARETFLLFVAHAIRSDIVTTRITQNAGAMMSCLYPGAFFRSGRLTNHGIGEEEFVRLFPIQVEDCYVCNCSQKEEHQKHCAYWYVGQDIGLASQAIVLRWIRRAWRWPTATRNSTLTLSEMVSFW